MIVDKHLGGVQFLVLKPQIPNFLLGRPRLKSFQLTPTHNQPLLTAFLLSMMSSLQSSEWAGRFR